MLSNNIAPILDALHRPLHDIRISVTDRCNFNCTYCMPDKNIQFLPKSQLLTFEEITDVISVVQSLGVKKVKITGGEPTLRLGLDILIKKIRDISGIEDIGLITNGAFLKTLGKRLYNAGLKRINISLDSLDERIFQTIVGNTHSIHPVLEGIDYAKKIGFSPIKINCVIQRGLNEKQVIHMVEYFRQREIDIRFIEFMDVGSIEWQEERVVYSHEILETLQKTYPLIPIAGSYQGEVATRYKHKNSNSEVGFISSVSNPFCKDCNRLRLTANGFLYGCLFASKGQDIKKILRENHKNTKEALKTAITEFWTQRDDRYSEHRTYSRNTDTNRKKDMNFIGG